MSRDLQVVRIDLRQLGLSKVSIETFGVWIFYIATNLALVVSALARHMD